jgi:hypothetical protein
LSNEILCGHLAQAILMQKMLILERL